MDNIRLKQTVFGMIFILANQLQKKCDGMIEGLTIRQFMLLIMMKNSFTEPASLKELSIIYGGTRQNIKQLVDVLVKKKFLSTMPSLEDGRETKVMLTEYAYQYFEKNEAKGNSILEKLFFNIDYNELQMTISTMEKLLLNAEGVDNV